MVNRQFVVLIVAVALAWNLLPERQLKWYEQKGRGEPEIWDV
jgi:hypothetical protein